MTVFRLILTCHLLVAGAFASARSSSAEFVGPADFIVGLKPGYRSEQRRAEVCRLYALRPKYPAGYEGITPVRVAPGMNPRDIANHLRLDHRVEFVEPDYRMELVARNNGNGPNVQLNFPDDTYFREQWALYNPEHNRADIHALEAWTIFKGTRRVIAAILDSGIDYLHPDLAPNIWHNPGEKPDNGVDDDENGFADDVHGWDFVSNRPSPHSVLRDADPMDVNTHGTHVAGIVGGRPDNARGIAGVNHYVSMMAVKGLSDEGWGHTSDLIAGIYYAVDNGARVINASWGSREESEALYRAIDYARRHNVLFVAAAGNWSRNNDVDPFYPSSYKLDNIIAVAATADHGNIARFSHYGRQSVDLAAPGLNVLSSITRGRYAIYSGTSMAAPYVTGALALAMGYGPGMNYRTYRDSLLASVDRIPSLKNKVFSGGRLNAFRFLRSITPIRPVPRGVLRYYSTTIMNH